MSFKPLTLEDAPLFRREEKKHPLASSDVNFTNMFIWNDYYHFSWLRRGEAICLLARPEGGQPFALPPLGGGDHLEASRFLMEALASEGCRPVMSRVPARLSRLLAESCPAWTAEPDPDNDDYVYLSEKLITLSGRRMHQKKNHYNNFVQNNRYELLEVTEELIGELMEVEDLWLTGKFEKIGPQSH
ncbi:MAG: DUF2156 domain-containing protein, partial [Deltaproteobacteria bacterium]|nr:DUF2156 domain-containing protein [Deltaproteobacteria bacterium]